MPERARQERRKPIVFPILLAEAEKKQGQEMKQAKTEGENGGDQYDRSPVEARLPTDSRETWRRGDCPACGKGIYSYLYHQQGRGDVIVWECDGAHQQPPTCCYRKEMWETAVVQNSSYRM